MRRNKHGTGFKLKPYNQTFQHQGSTWDVIHKSADMLWAVELDKKGNAGGAVVKFPV
jgi:hypothetical protein